MSDTEERKPICPVGLVLFLAILGLGLSIAAILLANEANGNLRRQMQMSEIRIEAQIAGLAERMRKIEGLAAGPSVVYPWEEEPFWAEQDWYTKWLAADNLWRDGKYREASLLYRSEATLYHSINGWAGGSQYAATERQKLYYNAALAAIRSGDITTAYQYAVAAAALDGAITELANTLVYRLSQ